MLAFLLLVATQVLAGSGVAVGKDGFGVVAMFAASRCPVHEIGADGRTVGVARNAMSGLAFMSMLSLRQLRQGDDGCGVFLSL